MLIITLQRLHLYLKGAFAFAGQIQILHCRLDISDLLAKSVVLARLHFHLSVKVISTIFRNLQPSGEQVAIWISSLKQLFYPLNFHFPQINLILVLLLFGFILLVDFFCNSVHLTQFLGHIFNLWDLGVIDISLTGYLFVAFLIVGDWLLALLFGNAQWVFRFGQLYFNVP